VAEINGVKFIDDSKATNMAALEAALKMVPGRVHLIAGGLLKEKSVGFVKEVLAMKVVCVYVIGVAGEYLETAWGDTVKCEKCGTLDEAVDRALSAAVAGDTVLLSPGCASFDQFESYKARGDWFKKLVEEIDERECEE
jgi:UDP-N-acetylmuramoylalanine--D-glutamate ligase